MADNTALVQVEWVHPHDVINLYINYNKCLNYTACMYLYFLNR